MMTSSGLENDVMEFSNRRKKNLQIGNMNVSHVVFETYGSLIDMDKPGHES